MRIALLAIVLAFAACGPANRYPSAYEENFTRSCRLGGSSEAHCTCIWDRIAAEVPVAEFEAADAALRAGLPHALSERVEGFAAACQAQP